MRRLTHVSLAVLICIPMLQAYLFPWFLDMPSALQYVWALAILFLACGAIGEGLIFWGWHMVLRIRHFRQERLYAQLAMNDAQRGA